MPRGEDTKVKYRLDSGTHTRPDRDRVLEIAERAEESGAELSEITRTIRREGGARVIRSGEEFRPSRREREQNEGRLSRTTKVFLSPGIPGVTHDRENEDD